MLTNLYQAIVCPTGVEPTKDNTSSHTLIADTFGDALCLFNTLDTFKERDLVSLSYVGEAFVKGSIVDFE